MSLCESARAVGWLRKGLQGFVHEACVNVAGSEVSMGEDCLHERDVGIDALNPELIQCSLGTLDCHIKVVGG